MWLPPPWVGDAPPLDPLACTPQLVLVGTPKGGSTAMFKYLNGTRYSTNKPVHFLNGTLVSRSYMYQHNQHRRSFHPRLLGSFRKEMHIFDIKGLDVGRVFATMFPGVDAGRDDPLAGRCSLPSQLGLAPGDAPGMVRFEATPNYLSSELAVQQMSQYIPDARFLMMLREPVGRAISHLNMFAQENDSERPLPPAEYERQWATIVNKQLEVEADLIEGCHESVDPFAEPETWQEQVGSCMKGALAALAQRAKEEQLMTHTGMLTKGMYDIHLTRWFQIFSPRQTLVWSSKAFGAEPRAHLEQLVQWVGLDPAEVQRDLEFLTVHERSYPSSRPVNRQLMQRLVRLMEPHSSNALSILRRHGYHEAAAQLQHAWREELASWERLVQPPAAVKGRWRRR